MNKFVKLRYLSGLYNEFNVDECSELTELLIEKFGISRENQHIESWIFYVIDDAKFTLFMLEYPKYIEMIYE